MPQLEGRRGEGPPGQGRNPPPGPGGHAASFGLITSTGGIAGFSEFMLIPVLLNNGNSLFATFDIDDFNTEEDCTYTTRQEDVAVGRNITVHKVILVYKDIGVCRITIDVEAFVRGQGKQPDQYVRNANGPVKLKIGNKQPDNKLHTVNVDLNVVGERPQVIIERKKNVGSLCIISATPVGTMVEGEQL